MVNNLLYIIRNFLYTRISRELVLKDQLLYGSEESKYTKLCSALPTHFDCIFLTSQTSYEDVSLENEWLGFLSLGAKERMQKLEVLLFQLLMKRKCDPLMVSVFLVNLKCLKITWANTW